MTLHDYPRVLRERWRIVLIAVVVMIATAALYGSSGLPNTPPISGCTSRLSRRTPRSRRSRRAALAAAGDVLRRAGEQHTRQRGGHPPAAALRAGRRPYQGNHRLKQARLGDYRRRCHRYVATGRHGHRQCGRLCLSAAGGRARTAVVAHRYPACRGAGGSACIHTRRNPRRRDSRLRLGSGCSLASQ